MPRVCGVNCAKFCETGCGSSASMKDVLQSAEMKSDLSHLVPVLKVTTTHFLRSGCQREFRLITESPPFIKRTFILKKTVAVMETTILVRLETKYNRFT
jgi:hypothetical protein